jgi:hypothetical protein
LTGSAIAVWLLTIGNVTHNQVAEGSNPAPAIGRKPAYQAGFRVFGNLKNGENWLVYGREGERALLG